MFTLHNGDCLQYMRSLPSGSFDATITDPPWNMDYFDNDNKSWDEYAKWLNEIKIECERVSRFGVWIFQSTKAIPFVAHIFTEYQAFAATKNFCQMNPKSLPNSWDIAFYKISEGYIGGETGKGRNWHMGNTAAMGSQKQVDHPTPRPLDTMMFIISMFSWQTIFDPFMGSGTTGIACMKLSRDFTGCELEPKYYSTAEKRIKSAALQPSLFTPSNNRVHWTGGESPANLSLFPAEVIPPAKVTRKSPRQ
jgi:site-specific DNA-methyltransferase (adenine-specific)